MARWWQDEHGNGRCRSSRWRGSDDLCERGVRLTLGRRLVGDHDHYDGLLWRHLSEIDCEETLRHRGDDRRDRCRIRLTATVVSRFVRDERESETTEILQIPHRLEADVQAQAERYAEVLAR
jgi:hypothetical protein